MNPLDLQSREEPAARSSGLMSNIRDEEFPSVRVIGAVGDGDQELFTGHCF